MTGSPIPVLIAVPDHGVLFNMANVTMIQRMPDVTRVCFVDGSHLDLDVEFDVLYKKLVEA